MQQPRNNIEQLRAKWSKSGTSHGSNAAHSSSSNPVPGPSSASTGSKFAFRDPTQVSSQPSSLSQPKKSSSSNAIPAPPPKRNAASAGLQSGRQSPSKAQNHAQGSVASLSARQQAAPSLKGKGKGPALVVDDSALEADAFDFDAQMADFDEMEAEAAAFDGQENRPASPAAQPPPPPMATHSRPLSPKKTFSLPPSSSCSTATASTSSNRIKNVAPSTSTSIAAGADLSKIQKDLATAQEQQRHYQSELLHCVTTGTCESGLDHSFLEQLLKGVRQRIQTLQGQLQADASAAAPAQPALARPQPPAFTRPPSSDSISAPFHRSDSPLGHATGPSAAPRSVPAPPPAAEPAGLYTGQDFDDDEAEAEAEAPEHHQRHQAPTKSDDFDNIFEDLDEEDFQVLEAPPAASIEKRQSTPRQHARDADVSVRNITVIDSDEETEDEDQPTVSKHFQPPPKDQSISKHKSGQPDPRLTQHPWSRDVFKALGQVFSLPGFRKNQLEAVNATLSGKDVFVLMPTGGGKSLCYQLPAIMRSGETKGITIVISPLISLIQDQITALVKKGISSLPFNSDMAKPERDFVLKEMRAREPTVALIYVTPELLSSSGVFTSALETLHQNGRLARFVVDEAHCISNWGHDFRPTYKELDRLKTGFPDVPIIALTATANTRVRQDVINNLRLKEPVVLTQSFNRPNLFYEVRKKEKGFLEQIANIVKKDHAGQPGIIYCLSKKNCEDVANQLRKQYSVRAMHYHAGMEKDDRKRVQTEWQNGKFQVICATIAFGMGIDSLARFVIHHSLPKSLEGYYQETGRAGRDGKPSMCILFFAYNDTQSITRLIDLGEGTWAQKERMKCELRSVVQYCMNTTDCRRSQVLNYFGEQFESRLCGAGCDICAAGPQTQAADVTAHAKTVVALVKDLISHGKVTLVHCVDVYRGSRAKKILDQGHDQVDGYGGGSSMERGDVERLFQQLVNLDILAEVVEQTGSGFSATYLGLAKNANAVLAGKRPVAMHLATAKPPPKPSSGADSAKTKPKGPRKSNPRRAQWNSDDDDGDFIASDQDDNAGKQATHPQRLKSSASSGDSAQLLYAKLQDKRETLISAQPALEAVITDELLQEMSLISPVSLNDLYGLESLGSFSRQKLTSHKKAFQDLLAIVATSTKSVASARASATKQINSYAYGSASAQSVNSRAPPPKRKVSSGAGKRSTSEGGRSMGSRTTSGSLTFGAMPM